MEGWCWNKKKFAELVMIRNNLVHDFSPALSIGVECFHEILRVFCCFRSLITNSEKIFQSCSNLWRTKNCWISWDFSTLFTTNLLSEWRIKEHSEAALFNPIYFVVPYIENMSFFLPDLSFFPTRPEFFSVTPEFFLGWTWVFPKLTRGLVRYGLKHHFLVVFEWYFTDFSRNLVSIRFYVSWKLRKTVLLKKIAPEFFSKTWVFSGTWVFQVHKKKAWFIENKERPGTLDFDAGRM